MNLKKNKGINNLTSWSSVEMKADKTAELNISGYIGVPEWWQFDYEMAKEIVSTKEKMQVELKHISNLKVTEIYVNVDSLGGDPNHAQAMREALIKTGATVYVDYTGWSASAATIINPNKNGENTSMSATNMLLIHQARGCGCGVSADVMAYAKFLDKVNDVMSGVYIEQTGREKAEVIELMNVNNGEGEWLTADESREFGLIGTINNQLASAANYDLDRLEKFGYKIPLNKINDMDLKFGKKPINVLAMQNDTFLLHEGELIEGSELKTSGENAAVKAGVYETKDGRKVTVDAKSKVELIEDAPEATVTDENLISQVAELLDEKLTEVTAAFDAKIELLRKGGSKAVVPQTNLTSGDLSKIGTQGTAKVSLKAHYDKIQEKKRANQEK